MNLIESANYFLGESLNNDILNLYDYMKALDDPNERAIEFAYDYAHKIKDYLDDVGEEYDEDEDDYTILHSFNKEKEMAFGKWVEDNISDDSWSGDSTSGLYYSSPKIVKNVWCIHFSEDASSIVDNGFEYGTDDMSQLGLTTAYTKNSKQNGKWAFAYLLSDYKSFYKGRHGFKYGSSAVVFKASGVRVFHSSDEEWQMIFDRETATDMILVNEYDGVYYVTDKNDRQIFKSDDFERVVDWIPNNYDQYKNKIYVGKPAIKQRG